MSKKSLPKISLPTMVVTLPLSKIKVNYRPFIVREQKALLLAQESGDQDTILATILDVLASCSNGTVNPRTIPTADLAYFFVQLRIASVGPEIKFSINCTNCDTTNIINMNLKDVTVSGDNIKPNIMLTDTVGVTFRLPTMLDAIETKGAKDESAAMLYRIVETIYDEESVYQKSEYSEEEFAEWVNELNETQLSKIEEFVNSIPELSHPIEFECHHCKTKNRRLLEGLHSFFRFGADA